MFRFEAKSNEIERDQQEESRISIHFETFVETNRWMKILPSPYLTIHEQPQSQEKGKSAKNIAFVRATHQQLSFRILLSEFFFLPGSGFTFAKSENLEDRLGWRESGSSKGQIYFHRGSFPLAGDASKEISFRVRPIEIEIDILFLSLTVWSEITTRRLAV